MILLNMVWGYKKYNWFLLPLIALIVSCTHKTALQDALEQAGAHRMALENVLRHYEHEPLKRKAAEFLIANMPGQYSLDGLFLDRYYELLDSMQALPDVYSEDMRAFYDSIYENPQWKTLKRIYDLQTISPNYLIGHIDAAFDAWNSPWAKNLSFEEFCEYLLPYRVGNERLEPWMQDFRAKYQPIVDSLDTDCIDSIYMAISDRFTGFRCFTPSYVPACRPSSLEGIRIGSCYSYGALGIYIFRSLGIPIIRESTPNWINHAMGHEWATIKIDGKNYPILLGDRDSLGNHMKRFVYRPSKIYRNYYGRYRPLIIDEADVPSLFADPKLQDITMEYVHTKDIVLEKVFSFMGKKPKYAYLAVFNHQTWNPIAFGKRERNGYRFKNMSLNAVYLPVYYEKGQLYPAYYPIKVNSEGDWAALIPNTLQRQSVLLKRKFMDLSPRKWANAMVGSCFVFSKDLNFMRSDTLWVDTLQDYAFQTENINGFYRCMKYVPSVQAGGNIAEIEVYGGRDKRLEGCIIGNYHPQYVESLETMKRAFDGDVLSYSAAGPNQTDAWLGLDFGKMVKVDKLVYLPRSDDNFIREGELYELFYWDCGWKSLGQRIGSRELQYLTYDNVPLNALLLLRDWTKGKEERIFTYENGKQIWW